MCLSNFGKNTTNPSTQLELSMDSEAMESLLISESTQEAGSQAPDDGALLHLGEQDVKHYATESVIQYATLESSVVVL